MRLTSIANRCVRRSDGGRQNVDGVHEKSTWHFGPTTGGQVRRRARATAVRPDSITNDTLQTARERIARGKYRRAMAALHRVADRATTGSVAQIEALILTEWIQREHGNPSKAERIRRRINELMARDENACRCDHHIPLAGDHRVHTARTHRGNLIGPQVRKACGPIPAVAAALALIAAWVAFAVATTPSLKSSRVKPDKALGALVGRSNSTTDADGADSRTSHSLASETRPSIEESLPHERPRVEPPTTELLTVVVELRRELSDLRQTLRDPPAPSAPSTSATDGQAADDRGPNEPKQPAAQLARQFDTDAATNMAGGRTSLLNLQPRPIERESAPMSQDVSVSLQSSPASGGVSYHDNRFSTAGSAIGFTLQGRADVLRSVGLYNLWTSQAHVYFQQARFLAIQNTRYLHEIREIIAMQRRTLALEDQARRREKREREQMERSGVAKK